MSASNDHQISETVATAAAAVSDENDNLSSSSKRYKDEMDKPTKSKKPQGHGSSTTNSNKNNNNNNKKYLENDIEISDGFDSTEYEISNGLRHVIPFPFRYTANTKGRWIGRPLVEIFSKEFDAHPNSYYIRAFKLGHIKVNGKLASMDYKLASGDFISHLTHRHEPPVVYVPAKEMVIAETDSLLVVNKPASIPVHPSGAYRFNSMTYILAKELNHKNLHAVYRLDRLTSGVLVFAKSAQVVTRLMDILNRKSEGKLMRKIYLARVCGKFPSNEPEYLEYCKSNSKTFKFVLTEEELKQQESNAATSSQNISNKAKNVEGDDNSNDAYLNNIGVPQPGIYWSNSTKIENQTENVQIISLSYPLKVLSFKNGSQMCDLTGKPSYSRFLFVDYDKDSNTSLVKCEPLTGRTHQLRLHLQYLGFPIANDPDYGNETGEKLRLGELSSTDTNASAASAAVSTLATAQSKAMSKEEEEEMENKVIERSNELKNDLEAGKINERDHLDLSLRLNCEFCSPFSNYTNSVFSFRQLRHEGVWLHASRYFTATMQTSSNSSLSEKQNELNSTLSTTSVGSASSDEKKEYDIIQNWNFVVPNPSWVNCFSKDKVNRIDSNF